MKKLTFLVLVVIIAGGIYWMADSKTDVPPQDGQTNGSTSTPISAMVEEQKPVTGSGTYTVDTTQSMMEWQGKKPLLNNYTDKGAIKLKDGTVTVENGAIVSGKFTIDMASLATASTGKNSGEEMLTKHLKSDAFFDVEKYPTSTFVITKVEPQPAEEIKFGYLVTGDLTIKDKTQTITFPATITQGETTLTGVATTELDRTKWEIKYGSGTFFQDLGDKIIDDMFTVSFTIVASS